MFLPKLKWTEMTNISSKSTLAYEFTPWTLSAIVLTMRRYPFIGGNINRFWVIFCNDSVASNSITWRQSSVHVKRGHGLMWRWVRGSRTFGVGGGEFHTAALFNDCRDCAAALRQCSHPSPCADASFTVHQLCNDNVSVGNTPIGCLRWLIGLRTTFISCCNER